ncbi:SOS response-associated peptidase [Yoonia sp. 208BN28-4]|uniref:SOS response-associated peptidase n=1 Tax=Yoonia sp. 208BN28-4 TaxID=3126505 RepID=UPI00309BF314
MPGRLFLTRDLGLTALPQPPRHNIAPGQDVVTLTTQGSQMMRWGMIPVGRVNARGRPVMETIINARSETVFDKTAFADVKRCAVPADGWYEWTGEARRKTAWAISAKDGALLYFAAIYDIWTAPGGTQLAQVATLTCPPNADVRDIHHRMGVILTAAQLDIWLGDDQEAATMLMRPMPDGTLQVAKADDVDWTAP